MSDFNSPYAFAGNPLWVPLEGADAFDPAQALDYTLRLGGAAPVGEFKGRVERMCDIDVSDIARSLVEPYPEPVVFRGDEWLLARVSDGLTGAHSLSRRVLDFMSGMAQFQGPALLPGGLSNRSLLGGADVPVLGVAADPLLSPRCARGIVCVRESELAPLHFITRRETQLWVVPIGCEVEEPLGATVPAGVYAIDLDALRREYALNQGIIPAAFDVQIRRVEDLPVSTVARVFVTAAEPSPERVVVRFSNSFAVDERVELFGRPEVSLEAVDDDDDGAGYAVPRRATGELVSLRDRLSLVRSVTLSTGPIDGRRISLVEDLLASDEVWLPGPGGTELRAVPLISDMGYTHAGAAPQSLQINFRIADGEPRPLARDISAPGRVFGQTFDSYFN